MKRLLFTILILVCGTGWGFEDPQYRFNGLQIRESHAIIIGGTEVSSPDFVLWDPDNYVLASSGNITAATDIVAGGTVTAFRFVGAEATITEATIGTFNSVLSDAVLRLLVDSMGRGTGIQKTRPISDPPNMKVEATSPVSLSVTVNPGSGIVLQTAMAVVAETTVTIATPEIGIDRIDIVLVGTDGVPVIWQGTPGNPPEVPDTPFNKMLLYEIYVGAAPFLINEINLTDRRIWL